VKWPVLAVTVAALLLLTWQPALLVDHNRPGLPDLPKATPSGVAFFIAYLALSVSAALLVLTPLLAFAQPV
jgi:hypothetical protein